MVGTLPYMSPEQVRGRELDVRSDLYSLGVMLYYMLACRLPFLLPETDSEYELSKAKVELAPLPLITLRPETPAGLAEIVMYSIRNDPAERFQTAADFLDAILEYEKEAGSSRKASTGTQATLSPPDALVDPSVSTMPQAARPPIVVPLGPPENSQLVAPVSAISEEARPQPSNRRWLIAGAMLFLMILAGASALFLARKGNGGIDVNKDLSHLLRQIYADGIKTADEQAALDRMAREYSLDVLRIAQQEQEIKDRLSQAEKGLKQGMAYASQQNYEQAAKEFKRSVEIDPEYAPAWANLCSAHLSLNREQEAQAACEQALAVDAKNWLARYNLGSLYARKGDRDRAFRELAETLRLVSEDTSQRVTRAEILNHIKTDPMLSSLRNDARFAQLSGQR